MILLYVRTMKFLASVAFLALVSLAYGTDPKETMCVKLKNGMYKCKASGKIEKTPCCDTPSNDAKPKSKK